MRLLLRLPPRRLAALGRAVVELALARLHLHADHSRHFVPRDQQAETDSWQLTGAQKRLLEDVGFAIPRVAARLPWRADCLIQALAAKRWLDRNGISSQLVIGARTDRSRPLNAHAWLKVGKQIVTGGDVDGFKPFSR